MLVMLYMCASRNARVHFFTQLNLTSIYAILSSNNTFSREANRVRQSCDTDESEKYNIYGGEKNE